MTAALVCVRKGTGAGARGGAGTQAGYWACDGDGAGAAVQRQTQLLLEILRRVTVLLRGFRAAAEVEDPA